MEFLQGNHFVIGVSERKGGRSIKAVLERKSFAKRPFCSQFLERKGNGRLYSMGERNGTAPTKQALSFVCSTGVRAANLVCGTQNLGAVPPYGTNKPQGLTRKKKKDYRFVILGRCETVKFGSSTLRPDSEVACRL